MGVEDGECTAPIWWNKDKTAEHSDVVKAIEYISKDYLIRWAKEKKAELLDDELTDVAAGINMGMDMLIYKLKKQ